MFKLHCIIANLPEDDISLSYLLQVKILWMVQTWFEHGANFKSLPATLITGFALSEFVKSGPRKKLTRRGATLNTGFIAQWWYVDIVC